MTISCIIIDDEPVARQGVEDYVRKIDFLTLLGSYSNPEKIEKSILSQVELLFLDIKLHKINGLEFYEKLKPNAPFAIVISAYSEYALTGFELNVVDYLLKPVAFERFQEASLRVKELKNLKENNEAYYDDDNGYFFIKTDNRIQKIVYDDILYVEGLSNYVAIYTVQKKYLSYLSLNILMERLPKNKFIRVHRSYLAAIDKIDSFKNQEILVGTHTLPLGKSYKEGFVKMIEGKLVKK